MRSTNGFHIIYMKSLRKKKLWVLHRPPVRPSDRPSCMAFLILKLLFTIVCCPDKMNIFNSTTHIEMSRFLFFWLRFKIWKRERKERDKKKQQQQRYFNDSHQNYGDAMFNLRQKCQTLVRSFVHSFASLFYAEHPNKRKNNQVKCLLLFAQNNEFYELPLSCSPCLSPPACLHRP